MIFLIADVHTERKRLDAHIENIEKKIGRKLDGRDTIICLGDLFGKPARKAPSLADKLRADRKLVNYIDTLPFRMLCVHGNHDDAKRVWKIGAEPAEVFGQHAMRVGENIFYLDDGQVYTLPIDAADEDGANVSALILGGSFGHLYKFNDAPVMDKLLFRKRYQHLMNLVEPLCVDYVLAHDAPTSRLGRLVRWAFGKNEATDVLDAVEDNLVFYGWYCGHHHIDGETTSHHHRLYRREAVLEVPSENDKPFNWQYLVGEGREDNAEEETLRRLSESETNLIGSLVAINTAISPEDKMTSGGWATPYIPSDIELDYLEKQIEQAHARQQQEQADAEGGEIVGSDDDEADGEVDQETVQDDVSDVSAE